MKNAQSPNSGVFRTYRAVSGPFHLLIVASALVLAGCAAGEPPADSVAVSPSPSTAPPGPAGSPMTVPGGPAGTQCGKVTAAPGTQAEVIIRGGAVDCSQAARLITQYFNTLSPKDLTSPDGPGPIPLGEWTCGSGPANDPVTTCSTEDDRQVDGVLAG
jgi:hypothetical protein